MQSPFVLDTLSKNVVSVKNFSDVRVPSFLTASTKTLRTVWEEVRAKEVRGCIRSRNPANLSSLFDEA
jgi:hypothetical protein